MLLCINCGRPMIYVATVYVIRPDGSQRRTIVRLSADHELHFEQLAVASERPWHPAGTRIDVGPVHKAWATIR